MITRKDIIDSIKEYYIHYYNQYSVVGYSNSTVLGRIIKGDVYNGCEYKTSVPKIEFTDIDKIKRLNIIGLALDRLRKDNPFCYEYIVKRFMNNENLKDITEERKCSLSSTLRLQNISLDNIKGYIETV